MNIVIDKHVRVKDKERDKKFKTKFKTMWERGKEKTDKFHYQSVYTTRVNTWLEKDSGWNYCTPIYLIFNSKKFN